MKQKTFKYLFLFCVCFGGVLFFSSTPAKADTVGLGNITITGAVTATTTITVTITGIDAATGQTVTTNLPLTLSPTAPAAPTAPVCGNINADWCVSPSTINWSDPRPWDGPNLDWTCHLGAQTTLCSGNPGWHWVTSPWNTSSCSTSCQQSRTVTCQDEIWGNTGPDSNCAADGPKPATASNCNSGTSCTSSGGCSSSCNVIGVCTNVNKDICGICGGNGASCSCTVLTYRPATSGFSMADDGTGLVNSASFIPTQNFYAYVDYGQAYIDSIVPPSVGGNNACIWDSWVGTAARFWCMAPSSPGNYTYTTGTNGGTSSNTCANGFQPIGTVTVTAVTGGNAPGSSGSTTLTGSNSTCDKITLTWSGFTGTITGYKIYRNTSNSIPASPIATPVSSPYTDSGLGNGAYYYWVKAYNTNGDSSAVAMTGNPLGSTACAANLTGEKDIVAVNHSSLVNGPNGYLNGGTDSLYSLGVGTLNLNDILSFSINLTNKGSSTTTAITVVDTMINLKKPSAGWNAKINGSSITPVVSGSEPNQTLTFTLTGLLIPPGATRSLTYDAQLAVPAGYTGTIPRFQNSFVTNYGSGLTTGTISTPLIPFSTSKSGPDVIEMP